MSRSVIIRGGAAVALAAAAGLITTTHGFVGWDGSWVLQVTARMEAGDVLYRDVFAGVPPLVFLIARGAARVWGLELLSLRVVLIVVLALSYLVAADLLRRVTLTCRYDVVLAGMMLVWALPANVSLYQPLANLCLLASLDAVAWWSGPSGRRESRRALPLFVAGAAAGLSFLSKHTIGAYALLAVAAAVAAAQASRRSTIAATGSALAVAGAGFALTVTAGLVPVAASGGWHNFVDYAFLNKGTYLRVANVPYFGELADRLGSIWPAPSFDLVAVVEHQPLVLPLLLVPALAVVVHSRRQAEHGAGLLVALAMAEAATLFPRADIDHVVPAVPGMLVVLMTAWHLWAWRLTTAWRRWAEAACLVAVAAGAVVQLGASASALVSDKRVWCDLPHLRHVLMFRARAAELEAQARALRAAAPSGQLFLLVPDASLYYLISGLDNPTPFDYPLVTAFGRTGEADLVRSIADGRLRTVCMKPAAGLMAPIRLQQAVLTHLPATADLGACKLYGARE